MVIHACNVTGLIYNLCEWHVSDQNTGKFLCIHLTDPQNENFESWKFSQQRFPGEPREEESSVSSGQWHRKPLVHAA